MQRYFVYLSYDGTNYNGWQIQPNGITIQQKLVEALSVMLQEEITVVGAGRTDAKVHAKCMVAHFDTVKETLDIELLVHKLNCFLPQDIAVQKITKVNNEAHARFSAISREYHYYVTFQKSPFKRNFAWQISATPDMSLMNEAAAHLMSYSDFTSFSKVHTDTKTKICTLTEAKWEVMDEKTWRFTIRADRFLRNMVRAIVGTLLDVGYGKRSVEEFCQIIENKNRSDAGTSVPGYGLFLVDVEYPSSIYKEIKNNH
ncbi:MAG: tRNA pseudouridine(38-40) synthase TruA [Bacteroidales bacterium]|nr:tRNA pseudouridine(38-40) synthase TruA [Bacteroidales bacterium]